MVGKQTQTLTEASRMTKAEQAKQERQEAIEQLREIFPAGSVVHTIHRHTSRSGMEHAISVIAVGPDGPWDVSFLVVKVTGDSLHSKYGGVKLGGAGMDMGFGLVYSLSRSLYKGRFECLGDGVRYADRCPSNDHSNEREPNYTPGRLHSDGGYALTHRWL